MCLGGRLHGRCCRPHVPHHVPEPPKPVPLVGVIANVKVLDFLAEVTLFQRFENIEKEPIEAIYEFPLPDGASVCSFYAIVEGKKIIGKIKEKEQAQNDYDDAIASGNSAYLMEQVSDKENTFKTSIGNLPAKEDVVIAITYVTELIFNDKNLEFILPTDTTAYPDGVRVPKFYSGRREQQLDYKLAEGVPHYGLKVNISFDMTSKITQISSPSHPITYQPGQTDRKANIALANESDVGIPLVKDFVVRISLAEPAKPVFRVHGDIGMVALYPEFNESEDDEDPITEMIFVVDRSGSMAGSKIQKVRDTLQVFLRSLPLGTLFNIIGFGGRHECLFEDSKEYDESTLAVATTYVAKMGADLGGTNLLPPLKHAFSAKLREGIPRQVFVLTDGEVNNTQQVIDFVREHSNTSRVFAFGIEGASPALVNGIAKAGEGKAELISGNDNVEKKVMSQLKRALKPALTNLKINWGPLAAKQTPYFLPPLFSGSRLIAYGYLNPDATPGKIVLTGESVSGIQTFSFDVTAEDLAQQSDQNEFIPKLAARSMIRDLEEKRSAFHASGMNEQEEKSEIIRLSIKSGMLSKHTAFIAINERGDAVEGTMSTRNVNQIERQRNERRKAGAASPRGFFASTGAPPASGLRMSRSSSAPATKGAAIPSSSSWGSGQKDLKKKSVKKDEDAGKLKMSVNRPMMSKSLSSSVSKEKDKDKEKEKLVSELASNAPQSKLNNIIMKQMAAGYFTDDVLKIAGTTLEKLRANTPAALASVAQPLLDKILVTAFICGVLKTTYEKEVEQWELVHKKAIAWLKKESKNAGCEAVDFASLAIELGKLKL